MTHRSTILHALALTLALAVSASVSFPTPAAAQEPDVLFIAAPSLPASLRRGVLRVLTRGARVLDSAAYVRVARGMNLPPANGPALRRFGTMQEADVMIVAGYGVRRSIRSLRLRYYHGGTGAELLAQSHRLQVGGIPSTVREAILGDLEIVTAEARAGRRVSPARGRRGPRARNARGSRDAPEEAPGISRRRSARAAARGGAAGTTARDTTRASGVASAGAEAHAGPAGSDGGPDAEESADRPLSDSEPGSAAAAAAGTSPWSFDVGAGFGFGQRSSTVPMDAGAGRFSSSPFAAIHAALGVWFRPIPDSSLRVGFTSRYYTSVGLQAEDHAADGSTRTVDTRAQNLSMGLDLDVALADGPQAVRLNIEAGWGFRMLDSELPLSMPTYTLSGPYARVGLFFPLGEGGPVILGLAPEMGHIATVSQEVAQAGSVSGGFTVGVEAEVRVRLMQGFDLGLVYRGSRAVLSSERDFDMTDGEQFGILRATYRP